MSPIFESKSGQVHPTWSQNRVQSEKFLPPGGKIDHSMGGGWPSNQCFQLNSNCVLPIPIKDQNGKKKKSKGNFLRVNGDVFEFKSG